MNFLYKHFICEQDELEETLTLHGSKGWRLHTCEPVVTVGHLGTGLMSVFVVMDQAYEPEEYQDVTTFDDKESEGLAMKG